MKRFSTGARVKVTDKGHALFGKVGTVVRVRISDNGAWIDFDDEVPEEHRMFHDKEDTRCNHLMLYPDQCKAFK